MRDEYILGRDAMIVEDGLSDQDVIRITNNITPELLSICGCILLIGSASEGLATSTSDVDLYLLIEKDYKGELFVDCSPKATGGKAVEISLITKKEIECYKSMLESKSYFSYEVRELEKLHKLFKSTVIYGCSYYKKVLEDFNMEIFDSKVTEYHELTLFDNYQDLSGSEMQGDNLSTVNFARIMVDTAIEMLLASKGDTYPKRKWIPRRISKMGESSPLVRAYIKLIYGSDFSPIEQRSAYIESVLSFVRRIQYETYIGESAVEERGTGGEFYKISSWVFTFRKNGRYYVQNNKRFFEVDLISAVILMSMYVCRSHTELIEKIIADLQKNEAMCNIEQEVIEKRTNSLVKGGLLIQY